MYMRKHLQKHAVRKIHSVSPWVFFVIALCSAATCIFALRHNNITALNLRDTVNQVDKDNGDVETALRNLREYMYGHMNTSLTTGDNAIKPPIQLKYRYERLLETQNQQAGQQNDKIYTDAQVECEKQFPKGLSGSGRIPCIKDYIASHGIKQQPIPDALYKFDFVSPLWSPDLAGWSMLVAALSFILFLFRSALDRWIKVDLHDL